MSERRKAGAKNRTMAYIAAIVVHVLLIAVLLFNFSNNEQRETVEAFDAEKVDTVKASVIDESQIKDQQEKIKKADRERERKKREKKKREQDELAKIKKQADQEKKKITDLQKKQRLEKKKAEDLERQRKAIELKKKKEAEIAKRQEAAEKKRIEELQKQLAQEEEDINERRRINKLLAEEEAERQRQEAARRAKERTATVVSKFFAGIKRQIELKRTVDPSFETWRKSVVDIKLSPSGDVKSVRTIESSGLPQYDQSVETAIYAASPFEMPDSSQDPDAVSRLQNIELEVKHPNARR